MFTEAGAAQAATLRDNLVAVYKKHFGALPRKVDAITAVVRADLVDATHRALATIPAGAATGSAPASASSGAASAVAAGSDRPFPGERPQAATVKFMSMLPDRRANSQAGLLLLIGAITAQLNPDSTSEDRELLAGTAAEVLCMPRRRTLQVVDESTADTALCLAAAAGEFNMGWIDTHVLPGPLRMAASWGGSKVTSLVTALAPLYSARGRLMYAALNQTEGCLRSAQGALLETTDPDIAATVLFRLPALTFEEARVASAAALCKHGELPIPLAGVVTDIGPVLDVLLNNPDRFDRTFISGVHDQLVAADTAAAAARADFTAAVDEMITAGLAELTAYGSAWSLTRNRAKQALALAVGRNFATEVTKLMGREKVPTGTAPAAMASLRLAAWVKCLQQVSAEHDRLVEDTPRTSSGDFGAMLTHLTTTALRLATAPEYGSVACIVHPTLSLSAMIKTVGRHLDSGAAAASPRTGRDGSASTDAAAPRAGRDGSAESGISTASAAGAATGGAPGVAAVVYSGAGRPAEASAGSSMAARAATEEATAGADL